MSPHPATHRNGVCTGSLWKSHSRKKKNAPSAVSTVGGAPKRQMVTPGSEDFHLGGILAEANERQRMHEFCVLVGNTLWSYSDVWAYAKGDSPTSEIRIVGASAWNPPSIIRTTNSFHYLLSSRTASSANTSMASESISDTALMSSKITDFLILSYSGTHVRCSAPTPLDRDKWLAALHAGLDGNIAENRVETLVVLSKRDRSNVSHKKDGKKKCSQMKSLIESDMMVQSNISLAMKAFEAEMSFQYFVPPLPKSTSCNLLSCERKHVDSIHHLDGHSSCPTSGDFNSCPLSTGYLSPCDDISASLSDTYCTACGRYPPEPAMRIDAVPLPEYGMEVRVDLCHDCWIAQGVLGHVRYLGWLYEVEARDRAAIRMAWLEVQSVLDRLKWENDGLERGRTEQERSPDPTIEEKGIRDDIISKSALLELVETKRFTAFRQRSTSLDSLCKLLEIRGVGCTSDFIESISECARAAESSCLYGLKHDQMDEDGNGIVHPKEKICLKKEAFKVAGDMSAALKLLYEYALPLERKKTPLQSQWCCLNLRDNADMLSAILEFFLDLCDEGQMDAVAFFWPQLCHIHMQMLPPRDTEEMIRVELMEDFLLTVSIRYSVNLALNLVWGLTADLEESLGSLNLNSFGRRRRFAILRFLSELESLLFDFEGGWGGGGVSLHGMLSPSQHQAALLRDAMSLLQLRRRFGSHYLTRSVRLDKLRAEAMLPLKLSIPGDSSTLIAKNASYFSSHINFTRKLGDIAEKLRFIKLELRQEALKEELKEINSSGKILGGDPLNRLCMDCQFLSTVHIPINEGYVFRSKERTPVLLLAEVVKDSNKATKKTQYNATENAAVEESTNSVLFRKKDSSRDFVVFSDTSQFDKEENKEENSACDNSFLGSPGSSNPGAIHNDSIINVGRTSHRLLALTPRASEATNVTEEGKEMMADMIANLIVNQKNLLITPSVDKLTDSSIYIGRMKEPHPSIAIDPDKRTLMTTVEAPHLVDRSLPSTQPEFYDSKKISALGSVFPQGQVHPTELSKSSGVNLTADGQFRRDVLFAIMERGMRGSNVIAKGAATAARRAIQAMDRKRAIALINESVTETDSSGNDILDESVAICIGFNGKSSSDISINAHIDEGEVMEALRLLIIQNQVAQENLSSDNVTKSDPPVGDISNLDKNLNGVDAGEVDQRLAGCGRISSSVLSALRLWKGGIVSNGEVLELVQKDLQFLKQSAVFGTDDENKLIEDSAFWGRFSFGERWAEKKARLAASSPHGSLSEWSLIGCIVKSNDDLRQEAFVMQLIGLCDEAFRTAGLDLWLHPYSIVATGLSTGIIECVRNAMSFDSLKKRPGYGTDGLVGHFKRMTEIAADPLRALDDAKQNFVSSLAAYSLMSYLFLFKDRHNGNLLLDTAGHVIHIDFGFVFGIAPGGSFSLEQSTPFKLTDEMLEVMGGLGSPLFSEFVTLFCCGFLALQAHADTFLTVVEVTSRGSNFHCFEGKDPGEVVTKLRERFCPELSKSKTVAYALDLIKFATTSYGTKQYDYFQYLSQGIAT